MLIFSSKARRTAEYWHHICKISRQSFASSSTHSLDPPKVLFSNNHILVVNKPVGWHSVPNKFPSPKCLLSELQRLQLGGGSRRDFLKPIHRIDQPCSGVLLLAKTSKAASRITTLWKQKRVQKEYLVVISSNRLVELQQASTPLHNDRFSLSAFAKPRSSQNIQTAHYLPHTANIDTQTHRRVSLTWHKLQDTPASYSLLHIQTTDGARHMVRAMLAQVGRAPVLGDLRYSSMAMALPDQSVALHAAALQLDDRLKLGTLETFRFEAPMPGKWRDYFGCREFGRESGCG